MLSIHTGTDYNPRNRQDQNQMYSHHALPLYPNGVGINYAHGNDNNYCSTLSPSYATYSAQLIPSQNPAGLLMYASSSNLSSMHYSMQSSPTATLPSQPRSFTNRSCYPSTYHGDRLPQQHHYRQARYARSTPDISLDETEEQESPNWETMRSEPVIPALDGYPKVDEFDEMMESYIKNLSPKKQDKALIHSARATNIRAVLIDKKTTTVESAQFRFWAKKMFKLESLDVSTDQRKKRIFHDQKPVAIREKLFKILTEAHKGCQHGGRDKTSFQVRCRYSWVPKELISRYVKLCPTCQVRRGTNRTSTAPSDDNMANSSSQSSQHSSRSSRVRQELAPSAPPNVHSSFELSRCTDDFRKQKHNRWIGPPEVQGKTIEHNPFEAATSDMDIDMTSPVSAANISPLQSKFAGDPGTPYMSSHAMHGGHMNSGYHATAYHTMPNMHGMHQTGHSYPFKHDQRFKREHHF